MKIDIAHPTENGQQQATETSPNVMDLYGETISDASSNDQEIVVGDEQEDLDTQEEYEQQTISTEWSLNRSLHCKKAHLQCLLTLPKSNPSHGL